jgi:hypothetical protein
MRVRTLALLLVMVMVPGAAVADGMRAKAWSDFDTQDLGGSLLFDVGQPGSWSLGPLVSWADNEDLDSDDQWSLGVQWEMQVDPNAVVPIADWMGSIGEALGLPPTLTGRTYLVGEGKVIQPFESGSNNLDTVFTIGPGVGLGPLFLEYVYQIVDGSGSPALNVESGPVLRFGAVIEF